MLRLFRRARIRYRHFDADLQEELRVHEAMKREELERAGASPAESTAAARRALGNATQMREGARRVWIAPWLESVVQDARYAVRALGRQPLHSLVAIAVLVFGIGLPATLFNLFKGILLDPWPVKDPHEVVRLWARSNGRPVGPSVDEYRVMRDHLMSMSDVAAHSTQGYPARLQVPGRAEVSLPSIWISPNFFAVLGIRPSLGTGFMGDDDAPAGRAPLVISDVAWRRHFDGDPGVVGREVDVSGQPFVVTGVAPASFDGIGRETHLWMPLSLLPVIANAAWR